MVNQIHKLNKLNQTLQQQNDEQMQLNEKVQSDFSQAQNQIQILSQEKKRLQSENQELKKSIIQYKTYDQEQKLQIEKLEKIQKKLQKDNQYLSDLKEKQNTDNQKQLTQISILQKEVQSYENELVQKKQDNLQYIEESESFQLKLQSLNSEKEKLIRKYEEEINSLKMKIDTYEKLVPSKETYQETSEILSITEQINEILTTSEDINLYITNNQKTTNFNTYTTSDKTKMRAKKKSLSPNKNNNDQLIHDLNSLHRFLMETYNSVEKIIQERINMLHDIEDKKDIISTLKTEKDILMDQIHALEASNNKSIAEREKLNETITKYRNALQSIKVSFSNSEKEKQQLKEENIKLKLQVNSK